MPQPPRQNTGVLIGKKAIMGYLQIGQDSFYDFIRIGMPAAVINNRYYAHKENLEMWFQAVTRTQTRNPQTEAD